MSGTARPQHLLVTGGAGFIGSHLCERLVARGHRVTAVDCFDEFYDPAVKRANLAALAGEPRFRLIEADIREPGEIRAALDDEPVDVIVHLAARAGVRPSLEQPALYADVNVRGTVAMLELARKLGVSRFVFGSSSSVYGDTSTPPFRESEPAAEPISPYAATKRAGELACHAHRHLYGTATVCLRFFTVYGPRQRPDLAIHKFTKLMAAGEEIPFFGDGSTERDYTYVDDIVQGVEGAIAYTADHPGCFEIVNLGENRTVSLARLVEILGETLGVEPKLRRLPPQPGDVQRTCADVSKARALLGYDPQVAVEEGVRRFVDWFRAGGGR